MTSKTSLFIVAGAVVFLAIACGTQHQAIAPASGPMTVTQTATVTPRPLLSTVRPPAVTVTAFAPAPVPLKDTAGAQACYDSSRAISAVAAALGQIVTDQSTATNHYAAGNAAEATAVLQNMMNVDWPKVWAKEALATAADSRCRTFLGY